MLLSFWRKAHLILALTISLFLLITSITGVILSFEPISNEFDERHIENASSITVADLIEVLEMKYVEVIEVKVESDEFLQVSVITEEGEFETFYADPKTGEKIAVLKEESKWFSFSRKLHRSLFLGTLGRLTIGITAFLLLFIAISGTALVVKRQLRVKRFFGKIIKDNSEQYWHTWLGRLLLPVLILVSVTGTYLSLHRFGVFSETDIRHSIDFDSMTDQPEIAKSDFKSFQEITLDELESMQFPFTNDMEDYFQLRLHDQDVIVNQFNGEIISSQNVGSVKEAQLLSFNLHTGKGSITWSIILCLAALSILYFMYSGCAMMIRRRRGKTKNVAGKDDSSVVVLIGSETGSTGYVAQSVQRKLERQGIKVFCDDLNHYGRYASMEHLVVMTSTYGNGEAPANAKRFIERFERIEQAKKFDYSVVGFGSMNYEHFCKFAEDVNQTISKSKLAHELVPLRKVNQQSEREFLSWFEEWLMELDVDGAMGDLEESFIPKKRIDSLEILGKTVPDVDTNQTYLLELSLPEVEVYSGDLLAIRRSDDEEERFYSIGKTKDGNLLLTIRKHDLGICSTYLSELNVGERVEGRIQSNQSFRFPPESKQVIAICNGTGIAPFLGMAVENDRNVNFQIYWGGKSMNVLGLFEEQLETLSDQGKLNAFYPVFSAEEGVERSYVQDELLRNESRLAEALKNGADVMICGSMAMKDDVMKTLDVIVRKKLDCSAMDLEISGQIRSDCY